MCRCVNSNLRDMGVTLRGLNEFSNGVSYVGFFISNNIIMTNSLFYYVSDKCDFIR